MRSWVLFSQDYESRLSRLRRRAFWGIVVGFEDRLSTLGIGNIRITQVFAPAHDRTVPYAQGLSHTFSHYRPTVLTSTLRTAMQCNAPLGTGSLDHEVWAGYIHVSILPVSGTRRRGVFECFVLWCGLRIPTGRGRRDSFRSGSGYLRILVQVGSDICQRFGK